jgi:formylglycine-generating enzyme required for sulfatase activity
MYIRQRIVHLLSVLVVAFMCTSLFLWSDVSKANMGQASITPTFSPGSIATDYSGVEMVYVPGGQFEIGLSLENIRSLCRQEFSVIEPYESCVSYLRQNTSALHSTEVASFWMDRYEITIKQFKPCIGAHRESRGCREPGRFEATLTDTEDKPQVGIDWYDAVYFCNLRGARLPTEEEWEYAARGPNHFIFPWGNSFVKSYIMTGDNDQQFPTSTYVVGSIPGNRSWTGVYDLSGNAAEWVENRYFSPSLSSTPINSSDGTSDTLRVIRGGGWQSNLLQLTSVFRNFQRPDGRSGNVGLRCVRSGPPQN